MPDRVFDESLRTRLMAFQKATGLAADGVATADTWTKLAEPTAGTKSPQPAAAKAQPASKAEPASKLTAQEFPAVFDIASRCQTEDGVREYLRTELGLDLAGIIANIDSVVAG